VPGCVSAWAELSQKFGKLPFAKLFEPAMDYAANGFPISPFVAERWDPQVPELREQPGFAQAFLPGGRSPRAGEIFRFPDQAKTLEKIAATKGEAFYRGELAERIEAYAKKTGGAMTRADLAAHTNDWVGTISQDYRGLAVHEIPPNGQGIVCLMALGILSNFDVADYPLDSADSVHLQIEAVKLAFADARRFVADPKAMTVNPEQLLDPSYLKSRSKLINMKRAQNFGHGTPPRRHRLPHGRGRGRHDGVHDPVEFHGIRLGRGRAGTGISLQNRGSAWCSPLATPTRSPQQAPVPYDHPGIRDARGRAAHELRADGRQHAAAGPHADAGAHGRLRPGAAGRDRRTALPRGRRLKVTFETSGRPRPSPSSLRGVTR